MVHNGVQFTAEELPKIPDSWQWGRLGDLVDQSRGICYGIVQPGKHDESGVPMVNSQDVLDGTVASRIEFRVAKELHARFKRSTIRGGEVLLTLVGANFGRVAIAPASFAGFNCSRAVGIIPVLEHPQFVMFCLRSPLTRRFLDNWANTTAQPTFNLKEVANLPIPLPPLAEQKAIAHILGTLDDKIDLNRRMNATLEGMARALFQSWFVDFDPVRAKLDGRKPEGMDKATAALFPECLEESPLGHIPKGWKAGTVVEGFNFTMGQSPPGDTYNEEGNGLPFYQGRTDFGFRFPTRRIFCTALTRYARPGDTLVSVRAPVGDINMANEECCIGRGVASVRHKSGATSFTYHSMANLYPDFARFEAEGTVFGSINKDSFGQLHFVIPPDDIVAAYECQAGPLDKQIRTHETQSRTLASLRDTLLPKLLSGELRVPEAEKLVERSV